jgi:hypothetical protein
MSIIPYMSDAAGLMYPGKLVEVSPAEVICATRTAVFWHPATCGSHRAGRHIQLWDSTAQIVVTDSDNSTSTVTLSGVTTTQTQSLNDGQRFSLSNTVSITIRVQANHSIQIISGP